MGGARISPAEMSNTQNAGLQNAFIGESLYASQTVNIVVGAKSQNQKNVESERFRKSKEVNWHSSDFFSPFG